MLPPPLTLKLCLSAYGQMVFYVTPMGDKRVLGKRRDGLGKRQAIPSLGCLKQRCAWSWTSLGSWFTAGRGPASWQHTCAGQAGWYLAQHTEFSAHTSMSVFFLCFIVLTVLSTGFHRVHPALSFLACQSNFLCSSVLQWCKETLWAQEIWHHVNVLSLTQITV